jgi:hypothetical protein
MIDLIGGRTSPTANALRSILCEAPEEGLVNWTGSNRPEAVVNAQSRTDKLWAIERFNASDVPTVEVWSGVGRPRIGEWLPRTRHHRKALDLINRRGVMRRWPSREPDFWTKRENIVEEYRSHVFMQPDGTYRVVRTAHRIPKTEEAHPWVRSHRLGWKFSYSGEAESWGEEYADIACGAVAAIGLDFGAVDLGVTDSGRVLVLEVNSCPAMEGNTLIAYAEGMRKLIRARE